MYVIVYILAIKPFEFASLRVRGEWHSRFLGMLLVVLPRVLVINRISYIEEEVGDGVNSFIMLERRAPGRARAARRPRARALYIYTARVN